MKTNDSTTMAPSTNMKRTGWALIFGVLLAWSSMLCVTFAQTIAWQEDWESPSAPDNWYADFGYWEIGVPTYGPPANAQGSRAHQGAKVAATVLGGNYTDDRHSRLVYALTILIPAADLNPRLRFWHWWSFNYGDYGQVQISTNNGVNWDPLSPKYGEGSPANYSSSGRWTQAWLDLTQYAGRRVLLGLYFYSHNSSGGTVDVGPGWYVDEMVIEYGPLPPFISPDSFEDAAAPDRWVADFGVWEIGKPTSGPGGTPNGSNCLATILSGDYTDDRLSRVRSQPFVIDPAKPNPRLRFRHWWSFNYGDYGQVQISTNNGVSWSPLSPKYGEGSPANYSSSGRWTQAWLDLTQYAGRRVLLGLYFYSHNSSGGTVDVGPGWYVDEMVIEYGPLPPFISPDSFEDPAAPDRWVADFGVWEIGKPTSGPGGAHGGSNCLATILSGNYTDDRISRVRSQPFVVPPAETNPRLRFWHWYSFNSGDYGKVQISTNNGNTWNDLGTYTTSSAWTQPQLSLEDYARQTVRLAFYFRSSNSAGGSVDVAAGWYIDDIRLLNDPAFLLDGSPVVRTQETACVSLGIALDSPTTGASFLIEAPAGHLDAPSMTTKDCWSGTITPQSSTQWLVSLQNACRDAVAGTEIVGTLCFKAVSPHSAFVPLKVCNLVINNQLAEAHSYDSRTVNIAAEPLLEAWLDAKGQRMVTIYGEANVTYVIRQSTDLATPPPWLPGWETTVPANLFISNPVQGTLSNAPVLFLKLGPAVVPTNE